MARKKKAKEPVKAEEIQVSYTGNVTVQTVRNNKVIKTIKQHNEGGFDLFLFLANCLKGDSSTVQQQRPFYAVPIYKDGDEYKAASATAVPLASIKINTDQPNNSVTTVYKVLIPNTLVTTDSYGGVVIISTERNGGAKPDIDNFSMRVLLEENISAADKSNAQLITWSLLIKNKE